MEHGHSDSTSDELGLLAGAAQYGGGLVFRLGAQPSRICCCIPICCCIGATAIPIGIAGCTGTAIGIAGCIGAAVMT